MKKSNLTIKIPENNSIINSWNHFLENKKHKLISDEKILEEWNKLKKNSFILNK